MTKPDEAATSGQPTPAGIMQLATAYWGSQTLFTANRLGIFGHSHTPASADDLAATLGADARTLGLLLESCTGLGLLVKDGDNFRNSPSAGVFLVPGSPAYLGNAIRYSDNLFTGWAGLEQTVRTGAPSVKEEVYLGEDKEQTRDFVYAMHDRAIGIAAALVDVVDLGGAKTMLDVGGGPGTYSAMFARKYPDLHSTVLDLPGVVAHARDIVTSLGAQDRVSTLAGDYRTTHFPAGNDVVLISGVLHRETEESCRDLIRRANESLNPGGQLILSDVFATDDAPSRAFAFLFGLNMALTAPDGGVHEQSSLERGMQEAGLGNNRRLRLPPPLPHSLVTGRKA